MMMLRDKLEKVLIISLNHLDIYNNNQRMVDYHVEAQANRQVLMYHLGGLVAVIIWRARKSYAS